MSADFRAQTGNMKRETTHLARYHAAFLPLILFIGALATSVVLSVGGARTLAALPLPLGTLAAFLSYATGIFEPVSSMARVFSDLIAAQVNIERVDQLLREVPEVTDTPEVIARYGDSFAPLV